MDANWNVHSQIEYHFRWLLAQLHSESVHCQRMCQRAIETSQLNMMAHFRFFVNQMHRWVQPVQQQYVYVSESGYVTSSPKTTRIAQPRTTTVQFRIEQQQPPVVVKEACEESCNGSLEQVTRKEELSSNLVSCWTTNRPLTSTMNYCNAIQMVTRGIAKEEMPFSLTNPFCLLEEPEEEEPKEETQDVLTIWKEHPPTTADLEAFRQTEQKNRRKIKRKAERLRRREKKKRAQPPQPSAPPAVVPLITFYRTRERSELMVTVLFYWIGPFHTALKEAFDQILAHLQVIKGPLNAIYGPLNITVQNPIQRFEQVCDTLLPSPTWFYRFEKANLNQTVFMELLQERRNCMHILQELYPHLLNSLVLDEQGKFMPRFKQKPFLQLLCHCKIALRDFEDGFRELLHSMRSIQDLWHSFQGKETKQQEDNPPGFIGMVCEILKKRKGPDCSFPCVCVCPGKGCIIRELKPKLGMGMNSTSLPWNDDSPEAFLWTRL